MTVRQLLTTTDSRELSEWIVYNNLSYWQQRLATKELGGAPSPEVVMQTLFGKALSTPGGTEYASADY
jgi:hypothetical protein